MTTQQIPLQLKLKEQNTFSNFFGEKNLQLTQTLKQVCMLNFSTQEKYIYLWGSAQSGRTHLLQACCHQTNTHGEPCFYLAGQPQLSPDILENLEHYKLICIDDVDKLLNHSHWEESLFHLFNKTKEQGTTLIISASCAPTQLTNQLADLKSRLCSGLIFKLNNLNDEDKIKTLQQRAQSRGLKLTTEASQFILHNMPRDLTTLFDTLDTLDKASLVHQRKLTIPFIKSIII
jgi:DnaA-homolog protein